MDGQRPPVSPMTPISPFMQISPLTPSATATNFGECSTPRTPVQVVLPRSNLNRVTKARGRQRSESRTRSRSPSPSRLHPAPQSRLYQPPPSHYTHLTFDQAINRLRTRVHPLVSVLTGQAHPKFPRSILQFQLLTHEVLDELCEYYHQTLPYNSVGQEYPAPMGDNAWVYKITQEGNPIVKNMALKTKRRRWGRFIGLAGCESPVQQTIQDWASEVALQAHVATEEEQQRLMEEMVEKEWVRRMEMLREEAERQEKMGRC